MPEPLELVTPLILTYNEEANIARTLAGLQWASRIVVIDSGSSDSTLEILASHPCVEVVYRHFDSFAGQCNAGLKLIQTPWCLSLDADHVITEDFQGELRRIIGYAPLKVTAVLTQFHYLVAGKSLRGTLLPPRFNLLRPDGGRYVDDGHAHRFVPSGQTLKMHAPILHDDRKPLSRWLWAQHRYATLEVEKLLATPDSRLDRADRLRKRHVVAPFAMLILCLFWHRGILDGWRGWFYAFQRLYVEVLLSLMLWEARHGH